jgi:hypothetical protein
MVTARLRIWLATQISGVNIIRTALNQCRSRAPMTPSSAASSAWATVLEQLR